MLIVTSFLKTGVSNLCVYVPGISGARLQVSEVVEKENESGQEGIAFITFDTPD